MKSTFRGFTMIEMIIIIILIGIIGSLAADMLFQGSGIYVKETSRQTFISESRSAFWKLMRETQGQVSPEEFTLSDNKSLYLKNAKGDQIDFQTINTGYINMRKGTGNYNALSNSLAFNTSGGFTFFNNSFSVINPGQSGLSSSQAQSVWLSKLEMVFAEGDDTVLFASHIYPHNFRFGKKMSYHYK